MDSILALSVAQNASDLHLSSGCSPMIRVNGQLKYLNQSQLSAEDLALKLNQLLSVSQQHKLQQDKQLDFAYEDIELGRFRGNIFYQQQGISAAFRIISANIPTLSEINVPAIFYDLVNKNNGLILVTGATGSGKSTTLAAMIEYINQHQAKHIITLEDPIEFIYSNKKSLIQQREIARHIVDFNQALHSLLRQDPDVILLGELRDMDTIQAALTAAETGHLVLATLHTQSAIQSLERLVDVFPGETKAFIRAQLSNSLQAIINQTLVAKPEGGRKACYEVLINTPAVSHLIREGKNNQIMTLMQTGQQYGMQVMEPDERII